MALYLVEDKGDGIVLVTLNRPEVLNAISREMAESLDAEIREIGWRRAVRVVIVTGAGERAFSSGADLRERSRHSPDEKWRQAGALRKLCATVYDLPQPVIAAVHGWCLGGGLELACSCDLRIAAEDAVFSWPEMQLGAYPGGTAAVMFPRLVGRARAKELFFTARRVKAPEALDLGIVERVVERGAHVDAALALAREIVVNSSPLGAAAAKRMVNVGTDMSIGDSLALNEALRRPLEATRDYEEGIRAHFEKRRPVWTGE